MSVDIAREKYRDLLNSLSTVEREVDLYTESGKVLANTIFPDDFEYYACGLELVDGGTNFVLERFMFPVMPDEIVHNDTKVSTVEKTLQGVVSYRNNSFTPKNITIDGWFGRRFRLLAGRKTTPNWEKQGWGKAIGNLVQFFPAIKTGYGCTRILMKMFEKATKESLLGYPVICNWYNLTLNEMYVVELQNLTIRQSISDNMMYKYSLEMTAIAPIYKGLVGRALDRVKAGGLGAINQKLTGAVDDILAQQ